GFQIHCQHHRACAGYTSGSDGGQGGSDHHQYHLSQGQLDVGAGVQKDGGYALVNSGTIHIDRGAQGQYKGGNVLIRLQLIGALLGHRQGGGGRGGGKGEHHGRKSLGKKSGRTYTGKDFEIGRAS